SRPPARSRHGPGPGSRPPPGGRPGATTRACNASPSLLPRWVLRLKFLDGFARLQLLTFQAGVVGRVAVTAEQRGSLRPGEAGHAARPARPADHARAHLLQ